MDAGADHQRLQPSGFERIYLLEAGNFLLQG
jgi:hypothetical protein